MHYLDSCSIVVKGNQILKNSSMNCEPGQRTRYSDSLRAGRPWNRISVSARSSAPVQTGSGAHKASCTMVTGSLSRT
jgi:hypothetical protein